MVRKSAGHASGGQAVLSFDERTEGSAIELIAAVPESQRVPAARPADRRKEVLTVEEVNLLIQAALTDDTLTNIAVTGEVTGYRPNASGHYYFTLTQKEESGQFSLPCVMWKYAAVKYLNFAFANGTAVTVYGNVDYYSPSGKLQFVAKKIEPAAAGKAGMFLQKEEWRRQLQEEGVIPRPESEIRDIPLFPRSIGVVTSGTGSVLQDIKKVLSRRYPLPVLLAPAQVQGDGAEVSIVAALESLQGKVDVIILARGGGSFEDLFVFNHPAVVRAVRNSATPVITGIGHETDTTLVDFAGDRRAATPSVAAETAVPDRATLLKTLAEYRSRITGRASAILAENRAEIAQLRVRVNPDRLGRRLDAMHQETADLTERLQAAANRRLTSERETLDRLKEMIRKRMDRKLQTARVDVSSLRELLGSCDPKKPLERGYALVTCRGAVVRSRSQVTAGDRISVRLSDGEMTAQVEKIE